jgi:hypothetical protein
MASGLEKLDADTRLGRAHNMEAGLWGAVATFVDFRHGDLIRCNGLIYEPPLDIATLISSGGMNHYQCRSGRWGNGNKLAWVPPCGFHQINVHVYNGTAQVLCS